MTYTEDRNTFERDIFKPPHLARMLDLLGEFSGRFCRVDREQFLHAAMDTFWGKRAEIKVTNDIPRLWLVSLKDVAASRPRWEIWTGVAWEWVKPKQLRRAS